MKDPLAAELRKLAIRDANGISATARRLISLAIAQETASRG